MRPPGNWREIPAETIEEVIRRQTGGRFPPTLEELTAILGRQGYVVLDPPPHADLDTALTFHHNKTVLLPRVRPSFRLEMLLHETAEVLLRHPVAEEFHYPPSGRDEFHAVSTLAVKRFQTHLRQAREKLLAEEQEREEEIGQLRTEISDRNRELRVWMDAIERGDDPGALPMPDSSLLKAAVEALSRATVRLKQIRYRIRRL